MKSGDASGGDLAGAYPNPSVVRLQGNALSSIAPTSGQALIWNGTAWAPATAGAPSVGGDISGSLAAATVTALRNRSVSANAPTTGDVLSWSGAAWTPSAPSAPSLGGDLGGTSQSATVLALQNRPISSTAPTSGQVLTYGANGWAPAAPRALTIVEVVQTVAVASNSNPPHTETTVNCPAGTTALSAAWYAGSPPAFPRPSQNSTPSVFAHARLANGTGWQFAWENLSGIQGWPGTAVVYCASP